MFMKKMKVSLIMLLALIFGFSGCNNDPQSVKLKSDDDKVFYTMGFMLGSNLSRLDLSKEEMAALYKGIVTAAKNQKPEIEVETFQPKIQALFKERMDKVAAKEKTAGTKFMEDFLKNNPNAKKTESGLIYDILKEGEGVSPKETDVVEVHYHGTLTSGEVFDSSVERGKTVDFPLNRVIKGWTEGVQLLKEGGKIRLVIPSELAYGEQGAPPKIPGGATLVFDVELFKVNPEKKQGAEMEDDMDEGHDEHDGHGH
jgi:FKBP-type peptidyl-prolyl cis-trans isomerase FkpA